MINAKIIPSAEEDQDKLAMGLRVPTSIKQPTTYLSDLKKYSDIYNNPYEQMEVCSKLYKFNGIIGNAVDVLLDFAITKVYPEKTGNKKLDSILEWFFDHVNSHNESAIGGIGPLMQEIGLEWFTSGNAFPYEKWSNVKINDVDGVYKLPYNIFLLNPSAIKIPEESVAAGSPSIYFKSTSKMQDLLRKDGRKDPDAAFTKSLVTKKAIRDAQMRMRGEIRVNPKFVTHLKRRAKGYQPWGTPYLSRCFSAVAAMEKMRELDESIASGLLNLVTIFKIGTDERPASAARLRKFASLMANPTATKTLVWAHDIEVIQVGPDGKVLQFKDKFEDCKEEILISLGIPRILMSIDSNTDAWVAILSLVERLSQWRNTMSLWLEKVLNKICYYNDFKEKVTVKWERMNLVDDKAVKNLILSFYDRGLLSIQTSLKESGYTYDKEKINKESEQDDKELFSHPKLPFSGDQEVDKSRPQDSDPKMDKKEDTKTDNTVNLQEQVKRSK